MGKFQRAPFSRSLDGITFYQFVEFAQCLLNGIFARTGDVIADLASPSLQLAGGVICAALQKPVGSSCPSDMWESGGASYNYSRTESGPVPRP